MTLLELIKACRTELSEAKAQLKGGCEDVALACLDRVRHIIERELKEKGR